MKKVILVSPLPPPIGGIASWTQSFVKFYKKEGLEYSLINSAVSGTRVETGKVSFYDELKRVLKLRRFLNKEINKNEEIVIHYNSSCSTFGLIKDLIILIGCSVPIVFQCHCNLPASLNTKLSFYLFKKICKIVDVVCVLNLKSLEVTKKIKKEVYYIPNFIEKLYMNSPKINDQIKKCCFVGRVVKAKGIEEYIETAKENQEIEFYIIGPLEDRSLNLSQIPNLKFLGPKKNKEVIKILKEMDVYILPSYTEGFPLGVLEAMSCGLPVIATNVGAIPDMIGNGGGILIEPRSSKEITIALKKMISKDIREEMSSFNINKVKNEYLIDVVMKKFIEIYNIL